MNKLLRFLKNEDGPTAVEYAVMLALIVVVCLISIEYLGTSASGSFQNSADEMQTHFSAAGVGSSSSP